MKYDNGVTIESFTTIDNEILTKIYKAKNLTNNYKDVLIYLCREVLFQEISGIVRTEWWAAAHITASEVGCSERTVRRAYEYFEKRGVITTRKQMKPTLDKNGKEVWRNTKRVKFNTNPQGWLI